MVARVSRFLPVVAVAGLAAACEQPSPMAPPDLADVAAAVALPTAALPNEVWVCKDAPAGSFSFSVSLTNAAPGATVHETSPTIAAGACVKVASGGGAIANITENDPSPYVLEKVEIYQIPLATPTARQLISTEYTLATSAQYGDRGLIFVYTNVSPPTTGCTLTQGYWKTHNATFKGGAPVDPTWAVLPGGLAESTVFYLSGQTWFEVFWTAPAGNAYYNLAHQFMAAKLNILAGADPTAVNSAIAAAEALFATYTPAQIGALAKNSSLRADFLSLASTLDDYNNGLIGPGHCSDVPADIP